MTFKPLDLMLDRVYRYGADSDPALFNELLYAGEFVAKITTAALVSAIEDDCENHRYRMLHSLVRADGVGDWAQVLDEILIGPASQELAGDLSDAGRVFTERLGKGNWQHESVRDLHQVLMGVYDGTQPIGGKVPLRDWFRIFCELRNKTRGHGALTPATYAKLTPKINASIRLQSWVFSRAWGAIVMTDTLVEGNNSF